jgi:hypothetical protein
VVLQLGGWVRFQQLLTINEMGWACSMKGGGGRGVYRILVGKPEEKRPLGRPRHRMDGNIKMDLLRSGMAGMDWINLAQNGNGWWAFVNVVMNLWVPYTVCGEFLD